METSTSYEIYWGTDLFISKFAITDYSTPMVIPGDKLHFFYTFLFIKTTEKKNHQINSLTAKIFNLP